jgi:hypothetical protein
MTRTNEVKLEEREERLWRDVRRALSGGLAAGINENGGFLLGLSVRYGEYETLLTIRAEFPGGGMVAFVASDTLAGAIRKAYLEAKAERLRWRADKYSKD